MNPALLTPTPSVLGDRVRLVPLTTQFLEPYELMLADAENRRFTGTHRTFGHDEVAGWLESRRDAEGRADWAILAEDGRFVGEAVLLDLEPSNLSAGFRISLAGPHEYGRGYGGAATQLVVEFGFVQLGLHRIGLEVYAFNTRAIAAYRRVGFVEEGRLRDALLWDGEWHDIVVMSLLADDPRPRPAMVIAP